MINLLLIRLLFIISLNHILLASAIPSSSSIWQVNIDNNPAPSPEDGPPGSANALRDPAYLPFQIGSIVGSYLVFIILISVAVLTVGRRLRRGVQTSPRSLNMEIVHPQINPMSSAQPTIDTKQTAAGGVWEITPISPVQEKPWSIKSWGSVKKHNKSNSGSVNNYHESVLNDDKARNEMEMDRLYAAVAEHENRKTQATSPPMPPMSPLNQHPPELQHLRYSSSRSHHDSGLLPSPPPEDDYEHERSPTSPLQTQSPAKRAHKPPPLSFQSPSRGSSRSSFSSFASFGRKKTPSVRDLPISPPMGSPELNYDNTYADSAPLTPRHYLPGPPPTPPVQSRYTNREPQASPLPIDEDGRRYFFSPGIRSSRGSMSTTGYTPGATPRTATFPIYPPPPVQEEQPYHGSDSIAITIDPSSAAPTPRQVPSTPLPVIQSQTTTPRQSAPQNYSVPLIQAPPRTSSTSTDGTQSRRAKPAPLTLGVSTSNSSQGTLPLRTAPLPLRSLRSPTSTRPMSTIKNTELTRPDPQSHRAGGLRVPGTAGMVPSTPYSPFYMPMTPLTPMTPSRLVTREERKRAKKEEGKRALTQDDMVVSEEELWGEGY